MTTGCITVCINGRSTNQGGGGQNGGTCCRCYPGICKMRQLKISVTWRQEIRAKSRETSGFDSLLGSGPGEPVRRTYEGCKKPRPRRCARDSVLGTCWIAVQPIGQRRSAGRVKLEGQNWSFDVVYEVNTGLKKKIFTPAQTADVCSTQACIEVPNYAHKHTYGLPSRLHTRPYGHVCQQYT